MNRRTFLGLVPAAVALASVPKPAVKPLPKFHSVDPVSFLFAVAKSLGYENISVTVSSFRPTTSPSIGTHSLTLFTGSSAPLIFDFVLAAQLLIYQGRTFAFARMRDEITFMTQPQPRWFNVDVTGPAGIL